MRVRVPGSQRHIPTQKFLKYPPGFVPSDLFVTICCLHSLIISWHNWASKRTVSFLEEKILTNILGLNFLQNSPKISTCSETFICLFILAERRERSEFIVSSRAKRARSQHVNRALVLVAANLDTPSFFEYIAWCPPNNVLQRDGKNPTILLLNFFLNCCWKTFCHAREIWIKSNKMTIKVTDSKLERSWDSEIKKITESGI